MKKPVFIINTFKNIHFPEDVNPIVICDIDHTFIRPKPDYIDVYSQLKNSISESDKISEITNDILHKCMDDGVVKQTDSEGFNQMLERINKLGGKFVFLTARSISAHEKTIDDLTIAGLQNPEEFDIHYTANKITKGYYIQKYNLLQGYNYHVFIDDYPHNLESALQIYPNINGYLFKYN
jgi:hypothetical protein